MAQLPAPDPEEKGAPLWNMVFFIVVMSTIMVMIQQQLIVIPRPVALSVGETGMALWTEIRRGLLASMGGMLLIILFGLKQGWSVWRQQMLGLAVVGLLLLLILSGPLINWFYPAA